MKHRIRKCITLTLHPEVVGAIRAYRDAINPDYSLSKAIELKFLGKGRFVQLHKKLIIHSLAD